MLVQTPVGQTPGKVHSSRSEQSQLVRGTPEATHWGGGRLARQNSSMLSAPSWGPD